MNTFFPKEGGRQEQEVAYKVVPEARVIYTQPCVSAVESSSLP